jgi:hypothetical protein
MLFNSTEGLLEIMAAKLLCGLITRSVNWSLQRVPFDTASGPVKRGTNMCAGRWPNFAAGDCPVRSHVERGSDNSANFRYLNNSVAVSNSLKSSSLLSTASGVTCCLSLPGRPSTFRSKPKVNCYGAGQRGNLRYLPFHKRAHLKIEVVTLGVSLAWRRGYEPPLASKPRAGSSK